MKTVAFHNLGCKVNSYEMEVMQQKFENNGYKIVPFDTLADIYVINTCTVTNIADRKSRQMLHRAKKSNPNAVVVATGCYAQTDTEGAQSDEAIDVIVGNNNKAKIVEIVEEHILSHGETKKTTVVSDLSIAPQYEECSLDGSKQRTRVDVKIQDGCNQFCSYCAIPIARGRIRSRKRDDIIKEITKLAYAGYKEIVLTGIHLSSYGLENHVKESGKVPSYNAMADKGEYTNVDLLDVIDEVSKISGIERIRLGSLEPRVITRDFLSRISKNTKVCPHFHISMQSGCDDTLKRMNRHYTTAEFYEKVELIREYYEHPAITTDIITGFPGESKEEFAQTYEFVKKVNFYETHVFRYSVRKGTVAASLPKQNTEKVKAARSEALIEINKEQSRKYREYYLGKTLEMLVEEEIELNGEKYMCGYTQNYVRVAIKAKPDYVNQIVKGVAVKMLNDEVLLLEIS
ncbi:MAG: tRNA (N(6)-L-threonylcarbamoyladenosine(37)-C(2))-methylthiotransferase MtaB [Lachnospiraceae bacterium]|nr:tRNA (N(6)-L-threonylcarbamoyladenosine(37)-C(2))-methylthiotransferase MtaB [Candidatus Colinaster equi]